MDFQFSTAGITTSAPVQDRRPTKLRWQDNDGDAIDTWLVKVYQATFANPISLLLNQFYVLPNANLNTAYIDLGTFSQDPVIARAMMLNGSDYRPSKTTISSSSGAAGLTFEIYSVTGGAVSSVLGTFPYKPLALSKVQPWDNDGTFLIDDYYPDGNTKQGFLTTRPSSAGFTRYDFALEDEAVANLLQLENYSYEYKTGFNLNQCNWGYFVYRAKLNGSNVATSTVTTSVSPTSMQNATVDIPLGLANMSGFTWSDPTFDLATDAWDYIEIEPFDGATAKAKPIRVYRDCRPIKHSPAQLSFINDLGGIEYLRFDGRVVDKFTTGSRESYKISPGIESFTLSTPSAFQSVLNLSTGKRSFLLSEDFFTDLERDLFKQALTSHSCLLRFQGKYYGGFIKTSSYNHEESSSRLLPIRCEFESSQDLLC